MKFSLAIASFVILIAICSCEKDSSTFKALKLRGEWAVTQIKIDEQDLTDSLTVLQVNYRFKIKDGNSSDTYELTILSADSSYHADMVAGSDGSMYIYGLQFTPPIPGFGALVDPSGTWDILNLTFEQMKISILYVDGKEHEVTFAKI
jgi:hypothetical protein